MALVCSLPGLSTVKWAPVTSHLENITLHPYFGSINPAIFWIQDISAAIFGACLLEVTNNFHSDELLIEPGVIRLAFLAYGVRLYIGTRENLDNSAINSAIRLMDLDDRPGLACGVVNGLPFAQYLALRMANQKGELEQDGNDKSHKVDLGLK